MVASPSNPGLALTQSWVKSLVAGEAGPTFMYLSDWTLQSLFSSQPHSHFTQVLACSPITGASKSQLQFEELSCLVESCIMQIQFMLSDSRDWVSICQSCRGTWSANITVPVTLNLLQTALCRQQSLLRKLALAVVGRLHFGWNATNGCSELFIVVSGSQFISTRFQS